MKKMFTKSFFLSLLTVLCYIFVLNSPMWHFKFKAPQYPQGLELSVYLTKTTGDVTEIDIINHYIGMQKLELAAQNEKAMVPYILTALAVLSLMIGLSTNKKAVRLLSLPIMGFPAVFVVIFYYWLYQFGHNLDPAAPVDLTPFTPTILGTGIIGQFQTFALPASGFYLATLASVFVLIQIYLTEKEAGVTSQIK